MVQLVTVCEKLGAGKILFYCMDKDGTNSGYDLELIRMVKAALAAGIFHRREMPIAAVKAHLKGVGVEIR